MKLFSMFTGYGGCCWGLKKANIDYELVGYSEIDKYAIQCFEQNFPENKGKNFGDCKKIDPKDLPDFDLLTGGFPCQDVSIAGKRDLSKGRTMLINDVFRIIKEKKPKYIVLENVKGLLSMKDLFKSIIYTLDKLGYGVSYKVLNSKEHGIPQNRERIWIICKLGVWDFMEFQFPYKEELKIFVKHILEENIDKKYYLSKEAIKRLINNEEGYHSKLNPNIGSCLFSEQHKISRGMDLISHSLFPRSSKTNKGGTGHLSKQDGTSYALDTGNCQAIEILDLYNKKSVTDGTCITLTEPHHNNLRLLKNNSIRRLTPRECFRLMGFLNDEIDLKGLSDTQCYKLAGNGWDVNLISKIFKNIFGGRVE